MIMHLTQKPVKGILVLGRMLTLHRLPSQSSEGVKDEYPAKVLL